MDRNLRRTLVDLAQTDMDAFHAYNQATRHVDLVAVREGLASFQADHQRHVRALGALLQSHGVVPPKFAQDFKGFLIEGMTVAAGLGGTQGTLLAMRTNEDITNRAYDLALAETLTAEARALVERNRADERRHQASILEWVEKGIWSLQPARFEARH